MTLQPRDEDEIYETVQDDLEDNVTSITNFVDGSFNDQFLEAYSEQIREAEIKALAAELAGYVEFAGRNLSQEDLDRLGITGVQPDEINTYMADRHLENLATNFSVSRDEGQFATGSVEFETSDDTIQVEDGYKVGTEPDRRGESLTFRCNVSGVDDPEELEDSTTTASPDSGATTMVVDIIAEEPGTKYNVGPENVTHLPNPQPGIVSVTNPVEVTGGEDEQSLDSLREDVQTALFRSSDGGTRDGVRGKIERNTDDDVRSVALQEFTDVNPPFVEVLVAGGDTATLRDLIDESKPIGIRHDLVRPTTVGMTTLAQLIGNDIDQGTVMAQIESYLNELEIDENLRGSNLTSRLLTVEDNIVSVPALNLYYDDIDQERRTYDDDEQVYKLNFGPLGVVTNERHLAGPTRTTFETRYNDITPGSVTIQASVDGTQVEVDASEFELVDADGDGAYDRIDLASDVVPDSESLVEIDYVHGSASFGSVQTNGTTYEQGVDYSLVDTDGDSQADAIEWDPMAETPDNGERFEVTYEPRRTAGQDVLTEDDEHIQLAGTDDAMVEVFWE